jgi:hypothetical protein
MLLSLLFVAVEEVQVNVTIDTVKWSLQVPWCLLLSLLFRLLRRALIGCQMVTTVLCWIQLQVGRQRWRVSHFTFYSLTNVT